MNCIRRLKRGKFLSINTGFFKFIDFLELWKSVTNTKFQLSISKIMPAGPKKTVTWGVNDYSDRREYLEIGFCTCKLGLALK